MLTIDSGQIDIDNGSDALNKNKICLLAVLSAYILTSYSNKFFHITQPNSKYFRMSFLGNLSTFLIIFFTFIIHRFITSVESDALNSNTNVKEIEDFD